MLITNVTISSKVGDPKVLPVGAFVRPIQLSYIPQHVLDNNKYNYDHKLDIYCYTRFGIIPIPKSYMRET